MEYFIDTKFVQVVTLLLILGLLGSSTTQAQTTAFTYQGRLTDAGNPANGNYDVQFKLFDTALVGTGTQQGVTLVRNPVVASAGVFTITLDFGANVFSGPDRFLEIGVRQVNTTNAYTPLTPRQPLTSAPYAIQTLNAQQLGGLPAARYVTSDASGNVGIGILSTGNKLDVNGAALFRPGGSGGGFISLHTPNSETGLTINGNGTTRADLRFDGSTLKLVATTAGIPPATNGIAISTAGNVGIGTSTPTAKLEVAVGGGLSTAIYGVSADNSTAIFGETDNGIALAGYSHTSQGFAGYFDGNVRLIGTLQLALAPSGSGSLPVCRSGSGLLTFCSSSLRNQTDLRPYIGGLNIIHQLQPLTFRGQADHTFDVGLGAEAVAGIEPLLVTHNDKGEIEGVKYAQLSVVLINAVKEQQKQLEVQRSQLERQQQQLESMKKLVCQANPQAVACQE